MKRSSNRKVSGRNKAPRKGGTGGGGFIPPAKYDEPTRGNRSKQTSARNKRLEKAAL